MTVFINYIMVSESPLQVREVYKYKTRYIIATNMNVLFLEAISLARYSFYPITFLLFQHT